MTHRIAILKEDRDCSNLDCGERIGAGSPALKLQACRWSEKLRRDVPATVYYCATCVAKLFPNEDWT